jgi:hypothetical protein
VFVVGLPGTPIFFILYKYIRIRRRGFLTLFPDKMKLITLKPSHLISINDITNIACNDALTRDGFPKEEQSEQLMNSLLNYKNIKLEATNFLSNPEILDM